VNKIPVGVLGASGYVGRELCTIIQAHPSLSLTFATANDQRGQSVRIGSKAITFVAAEDAALDRAELVFSALPHGASKEWIARAAGAGARVIDLSADLRPGNGCDGVPYGLTELARQRIADASVVANPGCYPTSVLLALAPLVSLGLIVPGATVTVNSASGVTGAGNSPKRELLIAEVSEDFRAYSVGNTHRHLNEMRGTLRDWGADADLIFTTHLLPVARGILTTIAVPVTRSLDSVLAPWTEAYAGEPFIEITTHPPTLRDVVHRNAARISAAAVDGTRVPTLLVFCAIDNLMKGAAGQAVQNANVMFGLPETLGLPS